MHCYDSMFVFDLHRLHTDKNYLIYAGSMLITVILFMQFKIHTDDCYGGSCSLCVERWPLAPVSRTRTHSSVHGEVQTFKGQTAGHCVHAADRCCCVWFVPWLLTTPKDDGGDGRLTTGHTTRQTQGFSFTVAAILNTSDQRGWWWRVCRQEKCISLMIETEAKNFKHTTCPSRERERVGGREGWSETHRQTETETEGGREGGR